MSKRLDNLNRVFLELRDRYGSDDALVLQVKEDLMDCEAMESRYQQTRLPFGERRVIKPNARFGNFPAHVASQVASTAPLSGMNSPSR